MIPKVLSHYHLPHLSCLGLVLFMVVFLAALAWVFRKGSSEAYAEIQRFPLDDLPDLNGKSIGETQP